MDDDYVFTIGERVQFIGCEECKTCVECENVSTGEIGTVVESGNGICFDEYNKHRHTLAGLCERGHGLYVCQCCIIPYQEVDEELCICDKDFYDFLK